MFNEAKDITYAKWRILAWLLHNNGEPLVVCPKCEYRPPEVKKMVPISHEVPNTNSTKRTPD
jgi:hypothetical protein